MNTDDRPNPIATPIGEGDEWESDNAALYGGDWLDGS